MDSNQLLFLLKDLKIDVDLYEHEAFFTVKDAQKGRLIEKGLSTKNLFLRDEKGCRHFLVVQKDTERADLKALAVQLRCKKLSFASPERLKRYLGLEPGSVGFLALICDKNHEVELYFDSSVQDFDFLQTHPLVNTQTVVISRLDTRKFLDYTGHSHNLK
ncbi:MAG: prolyl-tRNA synthetase associated domain-containing protein [Oligoflexales bacterium]